jgi:hypothetical protein
VELKYGEFKNALMLGKRYFCEIHLLLGSGLVIKKEFYIVQAKSLQSLLLDNFGKIDLDDSVYVSRFDIRTVEDLFDSFYPPIGRRPLSAVH